MVKNPPASAGDSGDMGSIPGSGKSPGEGKGNPLQYSCLGNPHGQRNLAGYSPGGRKESDMTEHAHTTMEELRSFSRAPRGIRAGPGLAYLPRLPPAYSC